MKRSALVLLLLALVLTGCSDVPSPSYRFTVEEVNYGEPSRYVFESAIAPGASTTFDLQDEIKVEVSRERQSGLEVMQIVLFDYLDSQLVSVGSGTIKTPERGVSLYEWQTQNGNSYKVEVLSGG